MRAVRLDRPRQLTAVDVPEPPPPAAGEALVRVHRVGVCGTDVAGYLGKMPFFSYPRIPGHELGVEVLAVGPGVANVRVGDRCAVEPYLNCQQCHACRRGFTNCCEHHRTLGVMCDGGLAERIVLPARKLHPSARLSYDQLALVETLAIGCHAVDRGAPRPGETALVIGAGPIGLSVVQFAKVSGARCLVMDTNPARLRFCAEALGVDGVVLAKGDGSEPAALAALAGGSLPEVVVDATGSGASMSGCLALAAHAGRVVYVGITQQELSFPHAPHLHRRELTILASRNALSRDFARIIGLIEEGAVDTKPWITHRCRMEDLAAVFPAWTEPAAGVIKAVVEVT